MLQGLIWQFFSRKPLGAILYGKEHAAGQGSDHLGDRIAVNRSWLFFEFVLWAAVILAYSYGRIFLV